MSSTLIQLESQLWGFRHQPESELGGGPMRQTRPGATGPRYRTVELYCNPDANARSRSTLQKRTPPPRQESNTTAPRPPEPKVSGSNPDGDTKQRTLGTSPKSFFYRDLRHNSRNGRTFRPCLARFLLPCLFRKSCRKAHRPSSPSGTYRGTSAPMPAPF